MQNYKLEREVTNTADWETSVKTAQIGTEWTVVPQKNKKKKKRKRKKWKKKKKKKWEEEEEEKNRKKMK